MPLRLSAALLIAVTFTATASAQIYVGVGSAPVAYPTYRPYPYYPYGGYLGYYPSAIGSQWTNGASLYGPPVPTYGPVAGAFGGSDTRLNYTRLYDPRPFNRRVPTADELVYPTFATVDLVLPTTDAKVTINEIELPETGAVRSFQAFNLQPGGTTRLTLRVRWTEAGRQRELGRDLDVRGGQRVRVDMTRVPKIDPAGSPPGRPVPEQR